MKILGLDVSTKSTGWFITKRSCGIISPPVAFSFGKKLVYFREELDKLLVKHKPDVVVIEDAYYRPGFGNIHTLKALVKFAGVAQELCAGYDIQTEIITATMARKHCCGDQEGPFKKREVFHFFKEKYSLDDWTFEKRNDITDAMALSWGYRGFIKAENKSAKKKSGAKKKGK
jgi:Holliday junction resolvasome RuvABC endonuclease subunit